MQTPVNAFKQALEAGETQIGLWVGMADGYVTEILAGVGFDWLLIDGEHAPNDLRSILAQLQAISSAWSAFPHRSQPVVRIPIGRAELIKQVLDIGAQTILVPMVDTPAQAAELVRAMRYPPDGIRGMGSALARASRWQAYPQYLHEANAQTCLLVQVESVEALDNLDAIAGTPGIDGVFIGPADLSASMGHVGEPGHVDVQAAIADAIVRIRRAGKPAGILSTTEDQARKWLAAGATFVAVGVDTILLSKAAKALLEKYKGGSAGPAPSTY
jgi:4-hydroxy-2-oxoheptanedioate aldolase